MPKPSVYRQLPSAQVKGEHLLPSPRHFNPGLLRYKGRLWLCYRYHLGREHASRCATALVPICKTTFQPIAPSQHLNLPAVVGDEHFEDARLFLFRGVPHISYTQMTGYQPGVDYKCVVKYARLFLFRGVPHISYTQMTGYQPGVDYKCVVKYARLRLNGNRWLIDEVFYPQYGRNHGGAKEKNWVFFEAEGALHVVYQDTPQRIVLRLEGDRVVQEYASPAPTWPWGPIRGGTPAAAHEGGLLAVFHSSLPTEISPHYVRYYGGAYTFSARAPFEVTAISHRPLMAGSESDGHGADPRFAAGWKPYVVFPCGLVPPLPDAEDKNFLVSLGVNDWQCAVGRLTIEQLHLGRPDRADVPHRYFTTANGSMPVQMADANGGLTWLHWEIARPDPRGAFAPPGLYATNDGREAEAMADAVGAEEITVGQYGALGGRMARHAQHAPLVFG